MSIAKEKMRTWAERTSPEAHRALLQAIRGADLTEIPSHIREDVAEGLDICAELLRDEDLRAKILKNIIN